MMRDRVGFDVEVISGPMGSQIVSTKGSHTDIVCRLFIKKINLGGLDMIFWFAVDTISKKVYIHKEASATNLNPLLKD